VGEAAQCAMVGKRQGCLTEELNEFIFGKKEDEDKRQQENGQIWFSFLLLKTTPF
jgi:hypothetical protein